MKMLLALTTAAAAGLAIAGTASAQECRGGFRMLPNNVPIACGNSYSDRAYERVPEAPLVTGSVAVAPRYAYGPRPYYSYSYYDRPYHRPYRPHRWHEPRFGVGFGFGFGDCWGSAWHGGWNDPYC